MNSQPDYYDVLRVKPTASRQEISRAYRTLMRTHHPDLDGGPAVGGPADGGELDRGELLQIMQAFAVLHDPTRRAAYDRARADTRAGTSTQGSGPVVIPVRRVNRRNVPAANTIRITPVHWESGPWA